MKDQEPKFNSSSVPDFLRKYYQAIESGTLREYYLEKFLHFKDDFLDDLPDEDVRNLVTLDEKGHFVGDNYKCRGNYIFALSGTLQAAESDGVVSHPELIDSIGQFRSHDFKFHHGEFTTPQEIDMINQILAEVIDSLGS
jgi:hypothetical protein